MPWRRESHQRGKEKGKVCLIGAKGEPAGRDAEWLGNKDGCER